MVRERFGRLGWLALMLAAAAVGCSSSPPSTVREGSHKITGTLTQKGQPLPLDENHGVIDLTFVPLKDGKRPRLDPDRTDEDVLLPPEGGPPEKFQSYRAAVRQDGTFEVSEGVPDGKYLITVRHFPKGRNPDVPLDRLDTLKGAFNVRNSKVIRDVKGATEINIDVGKPEG
ncbi:MAG: hypothetical protein L0Z62_35240 [Gemmataceae bacterium]|nr:hypothetical protein [Gemmataceae bacterium]